MADNATVSGVAVAADEVAYSGDTVEVQLMRLVRVSGSEGSRVVNEIFAAIPSDNTEAFSGLTPLTVRAIIGGRDANGNINFSAAQVRSLDLDTLNPASFKFLLTGAVGIQFNGSTIERVRGNQEVAIHAQAARTATPTKVTQTNYNWRGGHFVITVYAGSSLSITPTIQGIDPVSGTAYTILAGTAITGTGIVVLRVYPGLVAAANLTVNDVLPRSFAIDMVHGNGNSGTYSVEFVGLV